MSTPYNAESALSLPDFEQEQRLKARIDSAVSGVARLSGPLGGWRYKLATDPASVKLVKVGDSNSDAATGASTFYRRLYGMHAQHGEALEGLGAADVFTDGVADGTTTFTSATANFTADDVGRLINGKNIPGGAVITARSSATTVTLSLAATAGTALTFRVGRHIISGGNNGRPLVDWTAAPSVTFPTMPYSRDRLVADAPDLVIVEWLANDIREGLLGTSVEACYAAGRTRLKAFIDWLRGALPNADVLLVTPATFLSANTSGLNYVKDAPAGNINPAGLAQVYSTALRRIYLSFVGQYPNVDVLDTQAAVFGTRSVAAHPLMLNQLHPNAFAAADVDTLTPVGGGYVAVADAIAERIGFARNAFSPPDATRTRHELIVYSAPAAGQVRFISRDYDHPAPQAPIFRADSLYVNGLDGPIALTSASIDRVIGTNILGITNLGATDFAPYIGRTAVVTGAHAPSTTGDRQQVFIDLPSVAANSTAVVNATITGLATGNVGHGTGVLAAPGSTFATSGLTLKGVYADSTDRVKIVVENTTAGAIDLVGESWTFWVVR